MTLRLLSLVFAPFAFGTSAFVFIGLIDPMAQGLGVSVPVIGQLQTVFALACGIGGPLLAWRLAHIDRKHLLLIVLVLLVVMNTVSALAPSYGLIAGVRFAGGLFAALTLPLASTLAVNMVEEARRPDAIATVLAGYTLAFLIGMPLGSVLGDLYGWRAAFWFATAISVIAFIIIGLITPRPANGGLAQASGDFKAALAGDNPLLMLVSLLGFVATFGSVAYIGPVITELTGVTGAGIGGVQIATGVGSLLGLPTGAYLARMPIRRALTLLFVVILITQSLFTVGMLTDFGWLAIPATVVLMAAGSGALFATSPVIQTRLAATAGSAATLAFALNGSMLYFGQGLGAFEGGMVTAGFGLAWTGLAGAIVAGIGLVVISRLDRQKRALA